MEAASGGQQHRELPPGSMLDDKYRVERLLAVGGMGAVYVGTHVKLKKKIAIKVLNPQLSSPAMVERFHREAVTASQIGHEGIAQVTDLGTTKEGEPFIVMEYLEGESLAHRLKATGPLPVDVACEYACSILAPLEAAHKAGIVHRDLKPDNVFLVRQSRGEMVKLLDFGISRSVGQEGEFRLTTTGLVLGTPYYMSPEQARGDAQIGPGADIYAMGVMLYEMLVGNVPIQGDNYNQLMYRVMTGEYIHPRQVRGDIPEALEAIILGAMALDAHNRPPTAEELEKLLLPFCRATFREHTIERISRPSLRPHRPSMGAIGGPGIITGTDRTVLAPTPAGSLVTPKPVPAKSKAPLVAVLALVLVGAGVAGFMLTRRSEEKPAKPEPVAKAPDPVVAPPPAAKPPEEKPPEKLPEPANVTLAFAITPPGAAIKIDGKQILAEELVVARDDAEHTVEISASGYEPVTQKLAFDQTRRVTIALKKLAARPQAGKNPAGGKKGGRTDRIDTVSPYKQ